MTKPPMKWAFFMPLAYLWTVSPAAGSEGGGARLGCRPFLPMPAVVWPASAVQKSMSRTGRDAGVNGSIRVPCWFPAWSAMFYALIQQNSYQMTKGGRTLPVTTC